MRHCACGQCSSALLYMSSSLNSGPVLGPQYSTPPLYKGLCKGPQFRELPICYLTFLRSFGPEVLPAHLRPDSLEPLDP